MQAIFGPVTQHIGVRSQRWWRCLVTWFCYQLITKLRKKTATSPWSDPCEKSPWTKARFIESAKRRKGSSLIITFSSSFKTNCFAVDGLIEISVTKISLKSSSETIPWFDRNGPWIMGLGWGFIEMGKYLNCCAHLFFHTRSTYYLLVAQICCLRIINSWMESRWKIVCGMEPWSVCYILPSITWKSVPWPIYK